MTAIRQSFAAETRRTLALAAPMAAGLVGQMLLGFTDSAMVGRVGVVPLAASAFALGIFSVLYVTGIGLVNGVSILAAQAHGANRPREAGEVLRHGLVIGTATALAVIALLVAGSGQLHRLGAPPEVVAEARPFLFIIVVSILPAICWQCLKQYCEALSHPLLPMMTMLGGVLLNVGLSWILIYGHCGAPALGLTGAGWATLVTRVVLLGVAFALVTRSPRFRDALPVRWLTSISWARLRAQLAIGLPTALQLLLEVGTFAAAALIIGHLGAKPLAAHQIALSYAALTFMFPLSIGMAVGVRVGQAVGAGEWPRVRVIGLSGVGMAAVVMGVFACVYLLAGAVLANGFVRDPTTVALAAQLLFVAGIFQIFDGTQVVSMSALRGLNDTQVPTLLAFVAYWLVALPAAYFLGVTRQFGPMGVWWGLALGLAFAGVTLLARFLSRTHPTRLAGPPHAVAELSTPSMTP